MGLAMRWVCLSSSLFALMISGCATARPAQGRDSVEVGSSIEFATSEFTQPFLEASRDGKWLYFDVLGEIYEVSANGGTARQLNLGAGWKARPMLSPDGHRVAFLSDRGGAVGVWVKSLDSDADPVPYDVRDNADVTSATWVSNSEIMTTGRGLYDVGSFSLLTSSDRGLKSVSARVRRGAASMTSSIDGRFVYFVGSAGLARLDRVSGVESAVVGLPLGATQLRMAPDGIHLGFLPEPVRGPTGEYPRFSLLNLSTGIVTSTNCAMEPNLGTDGDGALPALYAFMPDGASVVFGRDGLIKRCVFGGLTSTLPILATVRVATAPRARWQPRPIGVQLRFPAAAPGGTQMAFTSRGRIWLLDLGSGVAKRLTHSSELEYMPSYSPCGSEIAYVAVGDRTSEIRVRDLATGSERVIVSSDRVLANPAWSPDGHRIAFVEAAHNLSFRAGGEVSIGWIDAITRQRGTFYKQMDYVPESNTNHYYPVLTWDRKGEGIFYVVNAKLSRNLVHQKSGEAAQVIYELDLSVLDVSVSPSGRAVALMDHRGISVAPAVGSNVGRVRFDSELVGEQRRATESNVDYMVWLSDDRLAWSVQDEVFVSNSTFDKAKGMKVSIPRETSSPSQGRMAYVGARIITMSKKQVVEDGLIVTNGRRIEYVGPRGGKSLVGAEIIDMTGKTIIPGLIDVHQHQDAMNRDVTPALSSHLFISAAYGVTTSFDPSFSDIEGSILREQSSEDAYPGATLYTAGAPILGPSGNLFQTRIDSYEDAVKSIRRKAQAGSIVVKDYLQPTRKQRRWLAQAARAAGLGITGHEHNDIRTHMTMVVDGFSGMEHTLFGTSGHLYGDVQEFLVRSGISMTPTLADIWGGVYFYKSNPPAEMYRRCLMQEQDTSWLAKERKWIAENSIKDSAIFDMAKQYAKMLNNGGKVTIGAHNLAPGIGSHWEMWFLAMAGATPMNVLRAATTNGAEKLGLEAKIGSLDVGMDADFVVLNSNPLDNIQNTTDISRVVRRGRTLGWPALKHVPATWTMAAPWEECSRWNLGLGSPRVH